MDTQLSAAVIGSSPVSGGLRAVVVGTALGCGLVAGAFFAFSSFVMPALNRLPAGRAVAAMQSINRLAVTPLFMAAVFGTALACLAVAPWAGFGWRAPAARWVLAGCIMYVIGAIIVTIVANVPLNNALDAVDPQGPGAAADWARYARAWTAWNHVRCAASTAATGLLTVGLALS
jgi:uncharacterized membrane protein